MLKIWRWSFSVIMVLGLAACGANGSPVDQLTAEPAATKTSPSTPTRVTAEPTSILEQTLSPATLPAATVPSSPELKLWIDPLLPAALRNNITYPETIRLVTDASQSDLRLSFDSGSSSQKIQTLRWTYALAARFPTVIDQLSSGTLKQIWKGGDTQGHLLLMDAETRGVFAQVWGLPGAARVKVLPPDQLVDAAWKDPLALAILPFEAIGPRWKVLAVDGFSVLERGMDEEQYPLSVDVVLTSTSSLPLAPSLVRLPPPNRDASKLLTLVMTGTTALVRKTAQMMNERGIDYPAKDIGSLLAAADLTHISNEVSFNPECSPTRAASGEGIFCSAPDYIRLLEDVGTDIVELTGNHNLDKGSAAYQFSLDQFQMRHWLTYGGGMNLAEARKPIMIQRGDTRLAFLGCNMAGPDIAWAGTNTPGAATCDLVEMGATVRKLRSQGVLPVVTFQAFETEDYMPAPMQRPSDFLRLSGDGAVIVSGSQSHFPQGFAFQGDGFIHYGLGNLFFDQVEPLPIRRAFIDRHVFYADQYLGVQLLTIMIEDHGRPRLMTEDERAEFLKDVFRANGW